MPRNFTYKPHLKSLARRLRKEGTLGEVLLWQRLKSGALFGYDFHRQKPIGDYIVDFFCLRLRLVIEVDGSSHDERAQKDRKRQSDLEQLGLVVLRFTEADVRFRREEVLASIAAWIEQNDCRLAR